MPYVKLSSCSLSQLLHSHKHFQLDVVGTKICAPLEQSTSQRATVTALEPCSAVIKRYKILTAALHGLGRHPLVRDIAVIAAVGVMCVGGKALAGMDMSVVPETKFYVDTKKAKILL